MNVKADIKSIISENLAKAASSIFIEKSLAIIDESAESKESLLLAADKISKRIALFIDAKLAAKVFDNLRLEIEDRELTPGTRRKHVRVVIRNKVYVKYNVIDYELYMVNISAGGMFIETEEPFPVGSKVAVLMSLKAGSHLHLRGNVLRIKSDSGKLPAGMAIEFKDVRDDEQKRLRDFVKKASAQDILER